MHPANRSFLAVLGAVALGLSLPAAGLAQEDPDEGTEPQVEETAQAVQSEAAEPMAEEGDGLVAVAVAQGNLTHFVALIEETGLASELSEGGPYTIFAPTDDAFAALEQEGAEQANDPQELRRLVRSHIAVGEWTSEKLAGADGITNLLADELELDWKAQDGEPATRQVDGADVIKADIVASNGVIHEIDSVLSAPPMSDMSASVEAGQEPATGSTEATAEVDDTGAGN